MVPCRCFPPGVACGAEGEVAVSDSTTSGAAPTSPPEGVFRRTRRWKYRRAVGKHYGPTRIHPADYSPEMALRYYVGRTTSRTTDRATSCTTDHAMDRATQRCSPDQRLLQRHRAVGPADVQRWIHTYGDRGPTPMVRRSNDPGAAGDRTRSAEVCYTPLDWTTRAAPSDYAVRRRRSDAGLTRVGTGRRRRLLQPDQGRAGTKIWRY